MRKMKNLFVAAACTGFAQGVLANGNGDVWVPIVSTDSIEWSGKKGSAEFANLDNKKNNGVRYIYQKSDKSRGQVSYGKLIVELASCRKGYGYIYYNTLEGKFVSDAQFVRYGSSVADFLGTTACEAWDQSTGKVSFVQRDNAWVEVAVSEKTKAKWILKSDAVRKTTYNKQPAVSGLFQYVDPDKKTIDYSEYVFSQAGCRQGYGTAYERGFNGELISKTEVVLDGNSVAAAVVKAICARAT